MSLCPCQSGLVCILEEEGLDLLHFYSISCSSGCFFLSVETSDPFMFPAKLLASLMTMISICALTQIISRLLLVSMWIHRDLGSCFVNELKGDCLISCCLSSSTKPSSLSCNRAGQRGWIPMRVAGLCCASCWVDKPNW